MSYAKNCKTILPVLTEKYYKEIRKVQVVRWREVLINALQGGERVLGR